MPKLKETLAAHKKRILVVLGALAALLVALTATDVDDALCQKWDACKEAYAAGSEPAPVSPTTVSAGQ